MKNKLVIFKKVLAVSFAVIIGVCSVACQGECSHRDTDDNGKCDICSIDFTDAKDKCDTCGGLLTNGECEACDETNVEETKCATCGGALTDGKCEACDETNVEETKCETCGGALTNGDCEACDKTNVEETKCETCGGALTNGKCAVCDKKEETVKYELDGKKIIFIGNSYTYYGQTVIGGSSSNLTQAKRKNDKGYFYQLCKANGANVQVTNWTFGGHSLDHLFCGSCSADRGCDGVDHAAYLLDKNYDYVVMQPTSIAAGGDASFLSEVERIMNFFKEGNPNTKFIISVPYCSYGTIGHINYLTKHYLNNLKTLANQGVLIVDWGGLVMNILNKKVQVPNATQQYTKNTFVVAKSSKDGYHPSVLSGYITTLMTYCAITGESAQGQTYAFCNDHSLMPSASSTYFNFTNFISTYYKVGTTNFDKVFASDKDMSGIQWLIDEHLAEKAYMNYNY